MSSSVFKSAPGSPPPMRGKAESNCRQPARLRITPAYAGKRFRRWFSAGRCEDHPRLCGEKIHLFLSIVTVRGSPPPMRGKVNNGTKAILKGRITPAYAGKSAGYFQLPAGSEDHPRLCGEKKKSDLDSIITQGSPPPMRGKEHELFMQFQNFRITPAYAGKSPQRDAVP